MFVAARSSSLISPATSVLSAAVGELLVDGGFLLGGVGAALAGTGVSPLDSERCAPSLLCISCSGVAVVLLLHCRCGWRPGCDVLAARGCVPSPALCALRRASARCLYCVCVRLVLSVATRIYLTQVETSIILNLLVLLESIGQNYKYWSVSIKLP